MASDLGAAASRLAVVSLEDRAKAKLSLRTSPKLARLWRGPLSLDAWMSQMDMAAVSAAVQEDDYYREMCRCCLAKVEELEREHYLIMMEHGGQAMELGPGSQDAQSSSANIISQLSPAQSSGTSSGGGGGGVCHNSQPSSHLRRGGMPLAGGAQRLSGGALLSLAGSQGQQQQQHRHHHQVQSQARPTDLLTDNLLLDLLRQPHASTSQQRLEGSGSAGLLNLSLQDGRDLNGGGGGGTRVLAHTQSQGAPMDFNFVVNGGGDVGSVGLSGGSFPGAFGARGRILGAGAPLDHSQQQQQQQQQHHQQQQRRSSFSHQGSQQHEQLYAQPPPATFMDGCTFFEQQKRMLGIYTDSDRQMDPLQPPTPEQQLQLQRQQQQQQQAPPSQPGFSWFQPSAADAGPHPRLGAFQPDGLVASLQMPPPPAPSHPFGSGLSGSRISSGAGHHASASLSRLVIDKASASGPDFAPAAAKASAAVSSTGDSDTQPPTLLHRVTNILYPSLISISPLEGEDYAARATAEFTKAQGGNVPLHGASVLLSPAVIGTTLTAPQLPPPSALHVAPTAGVWPPTALQAPVHSGAWGHSDGGGGSASSAGGRMPSRLAVHDTVMASGPSSAPTLARKSPREWSAQDSQAGHGRARMLPGQQPSAAPQLRPTPLSTPSHSHAPQSSSPESSPQHAPQFGGLPSPHLSALNLSSSSQQQPQHSAPHAMLSPFSICTPPAGQQQQAAGAGPMASAGPQGNGSGGGGWPSSSHPSSQPGSVSGPTVSLGVVGGGSFVWGAPGQFWASASSAQPACAPVSLLHSPFSVPLPQPASKATLQHGQDPPAAAWQLLNTGRSSDESSWEAAMVPAPSGAMAGSSAMEEDYDMEGDHLMVLPSPMSAE